MRNRLEGERDKAEAALKDLAAAGTARVDELEREALLATTARATLEHDLAATQTSLSAALAQEKGSKEVGQEKNKGGGGRVCVCL